MNRKLIWWGVCGMLFALSVQAQDLARLPYEMIYSMEKTEASLTNRLTNLVMFLRITPTTPGVKIADVDVYIHCKDGRIPITLNPTNGNFTVPMRESLAQEQAWIVANQPRGTMTFHWYIGLAGDRMPSNGIHYHALMHPLEEVAIIRDEMAKIPGAPPLAVGGMKMLFKEGTDASIVIHAKSGDRVFKTDDTHSLVVPLDPQWMAEDPVVSIPIPPEKVFIAEPADPK